MSFDPLTRHADMASLIAEVTGTPLKQVMLRLNRERGEPGVNVKEDFAGRSASLGCERYVYNDGMERFYQETDAFLYELAVWNLNRLKTDMGEWANDWITRHLGPSKVLSIGDGLGFECLRMAAAGHHVTYFEVPGYCARFAKLLFERRNAEIIHLTDPQKIPQGSFRAMICLDVLEHVPDPPAFVKMIMANLEPGGIFIVHAPFYLIHKNYPTHVRSSRRFSGDLSLYTDAGFRLLDARSMWNPLVLQAPGGSPMHASSLGKLRMSLSRDYLKLGRQRSKPFALMHRIKRAKQGWFHES